MVQWTQLVRKDMYQFQYMFLAICFCFEILLYKFHRFFQGLSVFVSLFFNTLENRSDYKDIHIMLIMITQVVNK